MASGILTDPALVLELRSIQADVFFAALVLVPVFEWLVPGDQRPGLGQFLRHTGRNLGLWTLGIVISSALLSGLLVMLMYALVSFIFWATQRFCPQFSVFWCWISVITCSTG